MRAFIREGKWDEDRIGAAGAVLRNPRIAHVCHALRFSRVRHRRDARPERSTARASTRRADVGFSACSRRRFARLDQSGAAPAHSSADEVRFDDRAIRFVVRLFAREARQFTEGAQRAGLSRGAYLVQLMQAEAGNLTAGQRTAQVAAVVASNGNVATLSRSVRHLATLLREGSIRAAQEYRAMLDGLEGDVRRHLALVAQLASTLPRPRQSRRLPDPAGTRSGGSS